MKLLGSTESEITKDKNGENVPHLEIVELVLIYCNVVNNNYQQNLRILYAFVPNKLFGSLLEFSPPNHIFQKTFNSEFQEIKVWFTDQNSKPLEVEDKIDLNLILNDMDRMQFSLNAIFIECNCHCIKQRYSIEPRERRYVKGYGFLSFPRNLGTHATKAGKSSNNKYGQKLLIMLENLQQMH